MMQQKLDWLMQGLMKILETWLAELRDWRSRIRRNRLVAIKKARAEPWLKIPERV